jgi:hypothetical protein
MTTLKISVITNLNPETSTPESEASAQARRQTFRVIDGSVDASRSKTYVAKVNEGVTDFTDRPSFTAVQEVLTNYGFNRIVVLEKFAA